MSNLIYNGKFLSVEERPFKDKTYEIVKMNNAVACLVMNKAKNKILLVKQYRPVLKGYTLEIPAGMLDVEGESPIECIVKELYEEANICIDPKDAKFLMNYCPIVGSVEHFLTIYVAFVDEEFVKNKKISNDDVEEILWVDIDIFEKMIDYGEIFDGKTLIAYNNFILKQRLQEKKRSMDFVERTLDACKEKEQLNQIRRKTVICSKCNKSPESLYLINRLTSEKMCNSCAKENNIEIGNNNWLLGFI